MELPTQSDDPLPPGMPDPVALLRRHWVLIASAVVVVILLRVLGSVLAPFALAGVLAYLGDPLVNRLSRKHISRTLAVSIVFVALFGSIVAGSVLLFPILIEQIQHILARAPDWLHWVQEQGLPRVGIHLPGNMRLDPENLRKLAAAHLSKAEDIAAWAGTFVGHSTSAVFGFLFSLILVPVLTFYLLRDWPEVLEQIEVMVPPRGRPRLNFFAREVNTVLSALIRGQLTVMAALAFIYGTGLTIAGVSGGLVIGMLSGLASFIPYLGFVTGITVASVTALVQTGTAFPLVWVLIIYAVGQTLEAMVLTPNLIGGRIGLGPVATLFALLAGGELFGFVGILVALPVAAVIAVMARHTRDFWVRSSIYRGVPPPKL